MNDGFAKRVRAAASALWWTVLVAIAFIVLQWIFYLAVMHTQPSWFLAMWGPDFDWVFVQMVWFWAIAILKFLVWLMVLVALWLTFWATLLERRIAEQ
jgi:hypothetical protein